MSQDLLASLRSASFEIHIHATTFQQSFTSWLLSLLSFFFFPQRTLFRRFFRFFFFYFLRFLADLGVSFGFLLLLFQLSWSVVLSFLPFASISVEPACIHVASFVLNRVIIIIILLLLLEVVVIVLLLLFFVTSSLTLLTDVLLLMASEDYVMTDGDRRAQKEWVFKIKSVSTSLARSAQQAQRNFDQYLTAMELVSALYKDYAALLSTANEPFLMIQADIPDLAELKASTARMHSAVHKWEQSENLYALRNHLHMQTDVLKSRSLLAAKVLDECTEREELYSRYTTKSAKLARKLRRQSPEAEALQKEVDKLEQRIARVKEAVQRDVKAVAVKSSASLRDLTMQFFKAVFKNGAYLNKHFHPERLGVAEESPVSVADENMDDVETGVWGLPRSPRSENSSIAPSGIYGVNHNRYHPQEAQPYAAASVNASQNPGIPLRYAAVTAVAAATNETERSG